jgi:NADPH:quinone reductase-like Zn-dependent oxidoreductase
VRPSSRRRLPFSRAGEAHRLIAERRNVGKVVLVPG